MMDFQEYLSIAEQAANEASLEILKIYDSNDFDVELKGDQSPLTKADKASHHVISEILKQTGLPILSEEGKDVPFEERAGWDLFWMVDPIDGTKEFIKRNGEFTVNIALIKSDHPVLGVVKVPVSGDIFHAVKGQGAFKNGSPIHVAENRMSDVGLRVVASRSHMSEETQAFVDELNEPILVSRGSSLKLLLVAEGEADLYPRYAPTMEWDTAAAQIVVEEAGGTVTKANEDNAVEYNKENLLNPFFLVASKLQ